MSLFSWRDPFPPRRRLLRRVFLALFRKRNENETSQQALAFRGGTPLAGSELLNARSLAVFAVRLLVDST